jgi:hypothetical protein
VHASSAPTARQGAYRLRARTRMLSASTRERGCGTCVVEHLDCSPTVEVRANPKGGAKARFHGMLTCGHIWTCPVCSMNLRSKRVERIGAALRGLGGRWQMLTITLRHRPGMPLQRLLIGLAAAWRLSRQGGAVQVLWDQLVTASVRAFEVTHGENGWHPHIHMLLRTEEWTEADKRTLTERFQEAVSGIRVTHRLNKKGEWVLRKKAPPQIVIDAGLGSECLPLRSRAIVWSEPFDASDAKGRETYLAKLGLEVAGLAKEGRSGSRSPWQIAYDASYGDEHSQRLWAEYCHASRGRRALELDDRASDAAERQIEAERIDSLEEPEVHTISIELHRDDVWALKRLEQRGHPGIFAKVLELAERPMGAREAVQEFLSYAREHARTTTQDRWRFGRHGHGSAATAHCDTS